MKSSPKRDKLFAGLSWVIVVGMFFAAVQVVMLPSLGTGPVASLVGITAMKAVYATVYASQGALLAYAKLFRRKRLRKAVLMSIYLFMGFTMLLSFGVAGFALTLLDNALIAIIAAICWLHWTFRTEYLNPQEFDAYVASQDLKEGQGGL